MRSVVVVLMIIIIIVTPVVVVFCSFHWIARDSLRDFGVIVVVAVVFGVVVRGKRERSVLLALRLF